MSFGRAAGGLSAIPLASLDAVVVDTETTGLDVKADQIIEIAGVRLVKGKLSELDAYQSLISPDKAIPAVSTAIHGITDKDVATAPKLSKELPNFIEWQNNRLWIGFSIDFDVAVFDAEFERNGEQFLAPRVLDLRDLIELLRPNLPDYALETVAGWLGVSVKDRHRALSDARITAEVFVKIVPMLEKKGIKTLAQAERATNRINTDYKPQAEAKRQVDSFAYRHKVEEIMTRPAWSEKGSKQLKTIVTDMVERGYSSVFVEDKKAIGVATQNTILRQINKDPKNWQAVKLMDVAHFPLPLVEQSEMLYRALELFSHSETRHIGVIDDKGRLVGALTPKDLVGQRAADDISFDRDIRAAGSREDLGRIWPQLVEVTRSLLDENVEPRTVANFISRELQALTHRACELAEYEMEAEKLGKPPVQYAMMVLGSGGRGESMLAMDQDNAIIYEASAKDAKNDVYFQKLGQKVADILDAVGVSYCNGGIMGSNAEWRRTDVGWSNVVGEWIQRSQPEDILHCDIFFDALGVHGELELVRDLQSTALEQAASARLFLKAMAMNAAKFKSPLGMFNRLKTVDGRVDLKIGGIMPIFAAARVLALTHGYAGRATPDRLAAAREKGGLDADQIANLDAAHRIFIERILSQQLIDLKAGRKLSNTVEMRTLSDADKNALIWALRQSVEIPAVLGVPQQ